MAKKSFTRVIDVNIRKLTPDWEAYEQPNAPASDTHAESKLQGAYHA